MENKTEIKMNPDLIMYSYRSPGCQKLLFIFFLVLFTSTAIPFRIVPIPHLGLFFRLFLMALIFVIFHIPNIKRSHEAMVYLAGLLLFTVWIATSLSYTDSFKAGGIKCIRFTLNVTLPCMLLFIIQLSEEDLRIMSSAILVGSILSLVVSLTTTGDFNSPLGRGDMKLSSGITLAHSFGLGFLVLFSRIVFTSKRHAFSSFIFLVLGLILLIGIILTGTRGVMISLVITVGAVLFYLFLKGRSLKSIILILLLLIMSGYLLVYNPYIQQTAGYKRYEALYRQTIKEMPRRDSSRVKMLVYSYENFKKYPITGIGAGGGYSFDLKNFEGVNVGYSHNIFMEIASEFGIIGLSILSLVLLPCWFVLARIIRNIKVKQNIIRHRIKLDERSSINDARNDIMLGYYENSRITIALLFLFQLIHAQVSGDIASNFKLWIMGFILSSLPPLHQGFKINGRKAFVEYRE